MKFFARSLNSWLETSGQIFSSLSTPNGTAVG